MAWNINCLQKEATDALSFLEPKTYMGSSNIENGLEEPVTCLFLNSALKQMSKQAK